MFSDEIYLYIYIYIYIYIYLYVVCICIYVFAKVRHQDNCQCQGVNRATELLCIVWNAAESDTNRGGITSLDLYREPLKQEWVSMESADLLDERLTMVAIREAPSKHTRPKVSNATGTKNMSVREALILSRLGCRCSFRGNSCLDSCPWTHVHVR